MLETILIMSIGCTIGVIIHQLMYQKEIKIPYRLMERDTCFYCKKPINIKSFWAKFVWEPITGDVVQAPVCDECSNKEQCFDCKQTYPNNEITIIKDTPETMIPLCKTCLNLRIKHEGK